MKLNLIHKKVYKKFGIERLKNFITEKKIAHPNIVEKIRQRRKLTKLIKKYNFTNSVVYIQSLFRRKIAQNKLKDLKAQRIDWKDEYRNDTNLIGDQVKEIPPQYIFKHDGYIFDLRELYKDFYLNGRTINPYTNLPFDHQTIIQISRLCKKINQDGHSLLFKDDTIPEESRISVLFGNFYSRLNDSHCYIDACTINNSNIYRFFIFVLTILNHGLVQGILGDQHSYYDYLINMGFIHLDQKYIYKYVINNFFKNPYLNHLTENREKIQNEFEITDEEYLQYINTDKAKIDGFLTNCLITLNAILNHSTENITVALIIHETANLVYNNIPMSIPIIII